jgi:hypothetical protein
MGGRRRAGPADPERSIRASLSGGFGLSLETGRARSRVKLDLAAAAGRSLLEQWPDGSAAEWPESSEFAWQARGANASLP